MEYISKITFTNVSHTNVSADELSHKYKNCSEKHFIEYLYLHKAMYMQLE